MNEKEKEKPEKRMTKKQAIEELENLVGSHAPIVEAESLKKQIALAGADEDAEISPEFENAVNDVKNRAKDSAEKHHSKTEKK